MAAAQAIQWQAMNMHMWCHAVPPPIGLASKPITVHTLVHTQDSDPASMSGHRPFISSCGSTISIPWYPDQEVFNERMAEVLANGERFECT